VVAALFGLILGSFASVVAHRVPRRESLGGRSRCPSCGHDISWTENIPLFGYLLLRGRCRHCGARIPARYPLIELATGGLFAAAVAKYGVSLEAVAFGGMFWVLVVLTAIDLEHKLLPNRIVFPAFIGGWTLLGAISLLNGELSRLWDGAVGALIFSGLLFVLAFIYPAGMGFGDVKLALVLGTFLGYEGGIGLVLAGMFFSFAVGGIAGITLIAVTKAGRKTAVPFGPALAMGTIAAVLVGQRVLDAYLGRYP
jgi:leader peptidase (prepilin peptidase) / N-methyltransferase